MAERAAQQELARDLGFLEAYTIGVGTMIGAGIFVLPSIAAANAGPASMVSFAIGGVVSLLAALSLSELATGMPRAGGSYFYVNRALGPFFGSIVGWGMWAGLMFATAFYMLGFGQYLTFFWGEVPVAVAALAMAGLLALINYRGVKEAGSLQNLIVVLLLGFILVFIAFGILRVDWEVFRPFNPRGWGAVATTAATVYVSFIGFEVVATSAEEIKDPGRNLPLAMIASVLTPTGLYVLVMLISTGTLPVPELAASRIPVADVAGEYLGVAGALMMVVGALLATISSANASILSAARVNFAMGRDRILAEWLNEVHPRFRTPYRAIVVTAAIVLLLIAVNVGIETLADVASFAFLATYALVHVSVIVLRRAAPEDYRPSFRLPGPAYPFVPVAGLASCLLILGAMRPMVMLAGLGILLLGAGWYALYASARAAPVSLVGEAIVGPRGRERLRGAYRIVVAVANPETQRELIRLAAAAAGERENAELVAINVTVVPPQTALDQQLRFEAERVGRQAALLESARAAAEDRGIRLRTRAIVGRDVAAVVSNVLREERARQLFIGWKGSRKRAEHILGTNIDRIVQDAECEVTLVKPGTRRTGPPAALISTGPHTPLAVRRAYDVARSAGGPRRDLTLVRVEVVGEDGLDDPERVRGARERGEMLIRRVADEAGVPAAAYEARVVVAGRLKPTIFEEASRYPLVFLGATRQPALRRALFGSLPEEVGERTDCSIAIVRGPQARPRTIVEALIERLTGGREGRSGD